MPKVSVIIPVYKVEKYLEKCLDSVINQTLSDIEIICVNDCSPDNSLEILKKYALRDKRIKIIDFKENKGVAIARNTAMETAKGEFINFVDPDDWIDLNFLDKLYSKAIENDSELVISNLKNIYSNGKAVKSEHFEIFIKNKVFYGLFQIGLYKKTLLNEYNIKFVDNCIYGEDRLITIAACYYAKNFSYVNDVYYYYLNRDDSATKNINSRMIDGYIITSKMVIDFINSIKLDKEKYKIISGSFLQTGMYLVVCSGGADFVRLKEFCNYIVKNCPSYFDGFETYNKITVLDDVNKIKNLANLELKKILLSEVRKIHSKNKELQNA